MPRDVASPPTVAVDAVTAEVVRGGLESVAHQMKIVLRRTSFSPAIYEVTDFSCAIFDAEVRLLAQAPSLPLFLGTLGYCVESAVAAVGGPSTLEPGDVLFTNDGHAVGSHLSDVAVVMPVFGDGHLIGYAATKAHMLDIGGKDPYSADTEDIFQEGVMYPGVRLFRRGEAQTDVWRIILANTRLPVTFEGDLNAQVSAVRTGATGLARLVEKHGYDRFVAAASRMFDHSEEATRSFVESVPDGRYTSVGMLDSDGRSDEAVPFDVVVNVAGSNVVVDLTSAPVQRRGPMNSPLASTMSIARLAVVSLLGESHSVNEGHFRPIELRTTPGTIFHALPPAPLFLYAWPALQLVDVIHDALAAARPDAVPAGNGGDYCFFCWWGRDERGVVSWAHVADHFMGQGGQVDRDGGAPLMHITGSGILNTPAEVLEQRFPFILRRFALAQNSAGAGRFRGGLGIDVDYEARRDMEFTAVIERTKTPPRGFQGGGDGRPNGARIRSASGVTVVSKETAAVFAAGSTLEVRTAGGGGFGPADERPRSAVLADVEDGYVSEAEARKTYPNAFTRNDVGEEEGDRL